MDQNEAAIQALRKYIKIENPGYAFMIEAPWGAGKTHLIKQELKLQLSNGKAHYVTLNGISDRASFRRAILAGTSEAGLVSAAGKFGNVFGKMAKLGNVGTLAQEIIENRMISNLPDLLVFDDIERCNLQPSELLGLLNDFIEHKGKNVVLCAFIERKVGTQENSKEKDFLSRKEKVVGRTAKIVANAQNALPEFISAMSPGVGKKWFETNQNLVLETFSESQHNNLRILRQCSHDCARVLDILDDDINQSVDALRRFVRTYLALSMALAAGEIASEDLHKRGEPGCVTKPNDGEAPHPLFECFKRHQHAEIFAGRESSIIPLDLGVSLIGNGYESSKNINELLRATGQFSAEQEIPLWRRFVDWRELPTEELAETHAQAKLHVLDAEEISPGPYLHLSHDLISIAKLGFGNEAKVQKDIVDRIALLERTSKIPAASYGTNFGWNADGERFSFGGYAFAPDENTRPIIEAMRSAQIAAYETSRSNEAIRLSELFQDDLKSFGNEFTGSYGNAGYYGTPILNFINSATFAGMVFEKLISGNYEPVGKQLENLARRHFPNSIPEETAWARKVKVELNKLAADAGPFEKARMKWFMGHFWKFRD